MPKTIFIGREDGGQSRLMAVVFDPNNTQAKRYVIATSAPNTVSRLRTNENNELTAHCKITVEDNGGMSIENVKIENNTFVNGNSISKKPIQWTDTIALGTKTFTMNLEPIKKILGIVNPPPPPPVEKSIRHLERVWNEYHESMLELQKKNRKLNLMGRVSGLCTLPCMAITAVTNQMGLSGIFGLTATLSVIGALVTIYSFYQSWKFDMVAEQEKLNNKLNEQYVCPHCGLSFNIKYSELAKVIDLHGVCPKGCKGRLTTK